MGAVAGAMDGARRARGTLSKQPGCPGHRRFQQKRSLSAAPRHVELPRNAHVPRGTTHMTKIVALANQKGGVGKTTTAINLGASVAACERRVLLVDLDPQANATSGIGVTEANPSMYDVLIENTPLRDIIRPTEIPTLHLAPSSTDLVGAEVELRDAIGREYYLKRVLEPVAADYDYILIDSPPSLGLLTVNGLTAANSVLVPLQAEYFALEGVTQLLATIDRVRSAVNPSLDVEGIVLTMYDERMNLARQVSEEVRTHFGEKVYKTVIPRNVRLSEAPSFGKPIILYDIRSRGSEAYVSLAREFIQRAENVI